MILIAEPVHFGDTHLQINFALAQLVEAALPHNKLKIIAEEKHIEGLKLKGLNSSERVCYNTYKKYSKAGFCYWHHKILGELRIILFVLKLAKKEKPELLIWFSLFPTGHLFLQLIASFYISSSKQMIVLHGEMEYLSKKPSKWQDRFLALCLKNAFKFASTRCNYLFLSETAKFSFNEKKVKTKAMIFSILHPFIYNDSLLKKQFTYPIKIIIFGALNENKNVPSFFQIANSFSTSVLSNKVTFSTIGKMQPNLKKLANAYVQLYKPNEFIPQKELEEKLFESDIALFFYNESMYQWSASGAICEAINQQLPIICYKNDFLNEILTQSKIGVCVDNFESMKIQIANIILEPEAFLSAYKNEFVSFIQQNSFHLQTQKIRNVLQNILS